MKHILFLLTASVSLLLSAWSPSAAADLDREKVFREGNEAYRAGTYGKAIEKYGTLVKENHMESPELYFNLANAYFKDDKPGPALYYYEKAHRLAPRDKDISFNLDFARTRLSKTSDMSVKESFQWLGYLCTASEISLLVSFIYLAFMTVLILYVFRKEERLLWLLCTLAFLFAAGGIFLSMSIYRGEFLHYGIVTAPSAELRAGPNLSESVSTIIPEGTKVRIMRNDEDWVEVSANGKVSADEATTHPIQGWIPEKELKSL
jgi:tetratricopeptide (TPR) repeat protein